MGTVANESARRDAVWWAAVDRAVSESEAAARALLSAINQDADDWIGRIAHLDDSGLRPASDEAPPSLAVAVAETVERCLVAVRARAKHLDRLHFVLFGRTGGGKSSFVETLTRGSGLRISPEGRLDYTRKVDPVDWGSVRVVDTPGIEGWAEDDEREVIEDEAHEAVKRADVVVLMFDDYNQKVAEFDQVAQWVTDLGKAAIAVLNVRDPAWRFDEQLWDLRDREPSMQAVRENVKHVEEMLASVGLPDVPVIAANLAWAFGARASRIRRHPHAAALREARKRCGRDSLERISNFDCIVELLRTLLADEPAELRLGTVHSEVRAALRGVAALLEEEQLALETRAGQHLRGIAAIFSVVGGPGQDFRGQITRTQAKGLAEAADALQHLGRSDLVRSDGMVERLLAQHLDGALKTARSDGLRAAQDALRISEGRFRSVSAKRLADAALKAADFDGRVRAGLDELEADLAGRLKDEAADLKAEFEIEVEELRAGFDANRGKGRRRLGSAAGVGSAVAAAAAMVFISSNPLGWAIGIGAVGGWIARKLRRSGHKQREEERMRAERDVAHWLRDVAADYRHSALDSTRVSAAVWGAGLASEDVATTATLRRFAEEVADVRGSVLERLEALVERGIAADLVARAQRAVEEARAPGDANADVKVWLGEDWLDQPLPPEAVGSETFVRQRLGDKIQLPSVEAEQFWRKAEQVAVDQTDIVARLEAGRRVRQQPPVVALCGDYSASKTSVLLRLALSLGFDFDPREHRVGGAPTTTKVVPIAGTDLTLVDTPGLNSGDRAHDAAASFAASAASLVLIVHTPSSGRLKGIEELLEPATCGRDRRALHVLARIDQLGVNPTRNHEDFLRLLEVKRAELGEKLERVGIQVHADLPLPVAADPGRRHAGARPWQLGDFVRHRGWDGIDDLVTVVLRLASVGREAAAVDHTVTGLRQIHAELAETNKASARRRREITRLRDIHQAALDAHRRVEQSAARGLEAIVEDQIVTRLAELTEMSDGQLRKLQEKPAEWLLGQGLSQSFEQWRGETVADLTAVYLELSTSIDARVKSKSFGRVLKPDGDDPLIRIVEDAARGFAEAFAQRGGDVAKGAAQKMAEQIPRLAPFAEQLGAMAAKGAGAVLAIAVEAGMQVHEARRERKRRERLESAKDALRKAGSTWVTQTLEGDGKDPGVLDEIRATRERVIEKPLHEFQSALAGEESMAAATQRSIAICEELIEEGCRVLVT